MADTYAVVRAVNIGETPDTQKELNIVENLASNYIIVEKILDELDWKDQMRCAQSCRLWRDVVAALRRRNLRCYDYVMVKSKSMKQATLEVSRSPVLAPLMISFTFSNHILFLDCIKLTPCPCDEACNEEHSVIRVVEKHLLSKKGCQMSVYGMPTIYLPLPTSQTFQYAVHKRLRTMLYGLYLPVIPNVNAQTIAYFAGRTVYDMIDSICATDIIKGVVIFVEERMLIDNNEAVDFLKYIKQKQPDIPFAMGGCLVETAVCGANAVCQEEDNEPSVTMAVFSVPRTPVCLPGPNIHFEMFSFILNRSSLKKDTIRQEINQFAANVPEMQYSACLKLSCVGRDKLHRIELDAFREFFPRTTIVGCYGDGEIAYPHPEFPPAPSPAKKVARDPDDYHYVYCTVFVYFCWGKLIRAAGDRR